jgi:hypothetical protein
MGQGLIPYDMRVKLITITSDKFKEYKALSYRIHKWSNYGVSFHNLMVDPVKV